MQKKKIGIIGHGLAGRFLDLALFNELQTDKMAHYLSSFADVINAGVSNVQDLSGWIVQDVEIFKVGTYRGVSYTDQDIQDMVDNFDALKGRLDPVLKIDHSESARDQVGWVLSVRKDGDLLKANLHLTEWEAYDKITNGTWKKVSAEIYLPDLAEQEFGIRAYVLRAVAIVSIPQVKDIQGIVLNSEAWAVDPLNPDPEKKQEGGKIRMDWEKFLEMLTKAGITLSAEQLETLKTEGVAAFTEAGKAGSAPQVIMINADQVVALAEKLTGLEKNSTDLSTQVAALMATAGAAEFEKFADALIQEGKVLPAEKPSIMKLGEVLTGEALAAYKETLTARPKLVDLGQRGRTEQPDDDTELEANVATYNEQYAQKIYK